jgi:DNA-binding response OmpR family regulator
MGPSGPLLLGWTALTARMYERHIGVMNVLLVEDEASLATTIARNLREHGHRVTVEPTVERAMLSMMEEWPDALVLEVNLPDASGWEILRNLGPQDRALLHVVMLSESPISQIRMAEFRPAHALQKPLPLAAVVRAVEDGWRTEEYPADVQGVRSE